MEIGSLYGRDAVAIDDPLRARLRASSGTLRAPGTITGIPSSRIWREGGEASDETIMDLAGHVSKRMLKHYFHIRMEAKRRAINSGLVKSFV